MAKKGGNPQNFNNPPKSTLTPLNVRLTDEEIDKFVRSLPNRTEWLRKAIAEKYEREVKSDSDQALE